MEIDEVLYNVFLAKLTPLWMADHDYRTLDVEMPISGDVLAQRKVKTNEGK